MDREKVINGLRSIKTYLASQAIETTDSFAREGFIESQKDIDDAIALLKEQEAVEPRVSTAEQRCGNCNKVIEMDEWKACPWCGKRIDWKGWWKKNGTRNQDS